MQAMAPTLVAARTARPPEGALACWGRPGAALMAPTPRSVHGFTLVELLVALAIMALLSITVGTLYQKRFVKPCDVRTANSVQLMAAALVTLPVALMLSGEFVLNARSAFALGWSVLVLTIGGSSLLYMLIQRGAAASVTSLMYLVPPCTAILAWILFGEAITVTTVFGVVLTAYGVHLAIKNTPTAQ